MQKAFIAVFVFLVGIGVSISFQNCGGSSLEANDSENGGNLTVDVTNEETGNGSGDGGDGTGGGDGGTGGGGQFSFNLNNGDNIFYTKGGGLSLDLATSRILSKVYYTMMESHIYEQRGTTFPRDLPTAYCTNSALPHCVHTTTAPCVGLGCFKGPSPVRCHWQKRMTTPEINNTFQALNAIQFLNRTVTPDEPMIADCNQPILDFFKETQSLQLSLADRGCVPDGMYYSVNDTGNAIEAIFDNELDAIGALMDNGGGSEYCNNYAAYAWDTTKFTYRANSGFTTQINSFFYEVTYENQRVNMRFKESGSNDILCANMVPVQNTEVDTLFPQDGIQYEVLRTNVAIADAPTSEITYEDPVDGGAVWRLFLTRASALTATGGAIMNQTQGDAISALIQNVLVNRAKTAGMTGACP